MSLLKPGAIPGTPYWWEAINWPDLTGTPPSHTELLVIGAGYTGLSAAIAAHDAGAQVAVLDAGQPGQGASTRNGGMVGAHPRLRWDVLADRYGAGTADALFAEAEPALNWVRDLIDREKIDCNHRQTGRIQLAYTAAHAASQEVLASSLAEKSAVRCHRLTRAGLADEIATPLYHGGLVFPDHGALHPAKYHRGLLNAVLGRAVPVIAHCPVTDIRRNKGRHVVQTPGGTVEAERVVLASNGYTSGPFNWFASRVFPLPSYMIATEPLPRDLIAGIAPGGRMMVETRARHSYFRVSPDGSRILFGGRAAMVNIDLNRAATRLHATMCEIWPRLRDVRLSHVWSGNTGYSFSHMPHVGDHDGIHYAMGFSGSGTVMAPYLGAKAAFRALGLPGGETAYADTALRPRWFHPTGHPRFLHAADIWYRHWVDRRETRSAGR